jgi:hypothetical protein
MPDDGPMTLREDEAGTAAATGRRRAPWQAVALEVTAALVAVTALVLIPLHYLAVRVTFLGAEAVIDDENVRFHWVLVGVLAVSVGASFAAAVWRRGGKAFVWHTAVAVAGLLVALTFSVTEAGPVQDLDEDPVRHQPSADRPGSSVCHSGGDSDECVGG